MPRYSRAAPALAAIAAATFAPIPCAANSLEPVASVILPWGDAVVALAQAVTSVLLPLAIAAATAAIAGIAGPLRVLVTATLVERLVRNVADYGVNAVAGAVRGRTLDVPLGSAVIARAVQRGLEQAPAWLIAAAGGPAGLAGKVFRSLPLDPEATAANTLVPALTRALSERTRAGRPLP